LITLRISRPSRRECLKLWQKTTSRKHSNKGGDGGTCVNIQEGSNTRVMAADRPYGEFYDFYSVGPEYFGYILVYCARLIFKIHLNIDTPTGICHLRRKWTNFVTAFISIIASFVLFCTEASKVFYAALQMLRLRFLNARMVF
jgi:hypothetical protein